MQIYASHFMIWYDPFESGKFGEEGKKSQKLEYFENEKSFLDEIKNFFIVLEVLSFSEKIKIW